MQLAKEGLLLLLLLYLSHLAHDMCGSTAVERHAGHKQTIVERVSCDVLLIYMSQSYL